MHCMFSIRRNEQFFARLCVCVHACVRVCKCCNLLLLISNSCPRVRKTKVCWRKKNKRIGALLNRKLGVTNLQIKTENDKSIKSILPLCGCGTTVVVEFNFLHELFLFFLFFYFCIYFCVYASSSIVHFDTFFLQLHRPKHIIPTKNIRVIAIQNTMMITLVMLTTMVQVIYIFFHTKAGLLSSTNIKY